MPKNIVIFSDGTGQGGSLLTDENRSNVYKLFRVSRECPASGISSIELRMRSEPAPAFAAA